MRIAVVFNFGAAHGKSASSSLLLRLGSYCITSSKVSMFRSELVLDSPRVVAYI